MKYHSPLYSYCHLDSKAEGKTQFRQNMHKATTASISSNSKPTDKIQKLSIFDSLRSSQINTMDRSMVSFKGVWEYADQNLIALNKIQ